ncbi:hypothetical protein [Paenibacillus lutrae]|uniref:Uncharacterized protein n=1 Tax=Paenibacillus lutrae TaxID=2078573 RepID=A0A7X3FM07_9BACL|nr:hypothetical protein [Paenibacillus lutrae]MVP02097.1 hypothetical protein [Paenibacillus lutrae]
MEIQNNLKGLLVHVLRNEWDSTNGGVSGKHNSFILVGENVPRACTVSERNPALQLRSHYGHLIAVPVHAPDSGYVGWMFGGNFIYSSVSGFPNPYPIPVHDRQEGKAFYNSHD